MITAGTALTMAVALLHTGCGGDPLHASTSGGTDHVNTDTSAAQAGANFRKRRVLLPRIIVRLPFIPRRSEDASSKVPRT
jgi:hypothetical protein